MIDEVLTLFQELSYLLLWLLDHQKWMQLDYHTAGPAIELSIFTFDFQQFVELLQDLEVRVCRGLKFCRVSPKKQEVGK